jgi:hypothetical protein
MARGSSSWHAVRARGTRFELMARGSCSWLVVRAHRSRITAHGSPHGSRSWLTAYRSRLAARGSRLTAHGSRLISVGRLGVTVGTIAARVEMRKRPASFDAGRSLCSPEGIRTLATALRGRRPRPLDDGTRTSELLLNLCRSSAPLPRGRSSAGVPGLEPRLAEPESAGLPITPYPIWPCLPGRGELYPSPPAPPNRVTEIDPRDASPTPRNRARDAPIDRQRWILPAAGSRPAGRGRPGTTRRTHPSPT